MSTGLSLRSSEKRPEWGILQARNTGTNQRGEMAFSFLATAFVPRRNGGAWTHENVPGGFIGADIRPWLAIDSTGTFLYAPQTGTDNNVNGFRIASSGTLKRILSSV